MFNIKLGKLIVKEVLENALKSENILYSDDYFAVIGESLIKDSSLFSEVMDNLDINISFDKSKIEADNESYKKTISTLSELVLKLNKDVLNDNKESYEYLGKLAYNHFCVDTGEYEDINLEDKSYLKNNPIYIWDNIPDKKKDMVKKYLLNPKLYIEDCETQDFVWNTIQDSIDSIVTNDLKYTYLADGRWCKLSSVGSFIWNLAMKHDPIFANVADKFSKEDNFNLYMELLGANIPDIRVSKEDNFNTHITLLGVNKSNVGIPYKKEKATRYEVYDFLNNVLNSNRNYDISNFSKSDWNRIDWNHSERSTEIYNTMLIATDKLFKEHLSHLVKWDEDELVWELLDNEEDYYLELTTKALDNDIKYEVFESNEGAHEILEIVFNGVKEYKDYTPNILLWYDFENDISFKHTGVISQIVSMHEEGYSDGLDIAYEGKPYSEKTKTIMNNIIKMISKKGFNYKMKEVKAVDENKDKFENEDRFENKENSCFTPVKSETVEISYSSKFEIVNMVDKGNEKFFKFSCDIPGVNNKDELEIVKNLIVRYRQIDGYNSVSIENPIKRYVGIDRKSLIKKISGMCSAYIRSLKKELEIF